MNEFRHVKIEENEKNTCLRGGYFLIFALHYTEREKGKVYGKGGLPLTKKNIPVVLDPVGAGASRFRSDAVVTLLDKVKFKVIRGNLSEMSFIAGLSVSTRGA